MSEVKSLRTDLLFGFAFQATTALRGTPARGQSRFRVAAGQAFNTDHVVAADCFDDGAVGVHGR